MRISFNTPISSDRITGTNGYGYATVCMLDSLRALGYEVNDNDRTADVQICFNQPEHWEWFDGPYKIGYHPWESTLLKEGWAELMNGADEIWTPSPLIADWYTRYAGITVPVHVYQHGVEHEWRPVKREPETAIKFLHVGAEASRKGGWETVRAFRAAFNGNHHRDDVKLTLKMINSNWNQITQVGRVHYINERYDIHQMLDLFNSNDIYIYPSWGEGFGLTPLQALATGMPTITVAQWAPYASFLDPALTLDAKLADTQWPEIHPGAMFEPDFDSIVDHMRYAADNYSQVRDYACINAFEIHKEYDWIALTKDAFEALENRLN